MALTAIERGILIGARRRLVEGASERICYAINEAGEEMLGGPGHHVHAVLTSIKRLRGFIMDAIAHPVYGQQYGLESWISYSGCTTENPHLIRNKDRMRATRIAWLDWLLDEPWTTHNGGGCPLLPIEVVTIRKRNGDEVTRLASSGRWGHKRAGDGLTDDAYKYDTVAYKVHYEAPTC